MRLERFSPTPGQDFTLERRADASPPSPVSTGSRADPLRPAVAGARLPHATASGVTGAFELKFLFFYSSSPQCFQMFPDRVLVQKENERLFSSFFSLFFVLFFSSRTCFNNGPEHFPAFSGVFLLITPPPPPLNTNLYSKC